MDQLHKVDVNVEEEDKTFLLLTLLPNSYNMVMTLLFGKDRVSLEDITASLLSNEIRKRLNLKGSQDFEFDCRVENCKGRSFVRGSGIRE